MNRLDLLHDDFSGHALIEASAGTGKTWTLTTLYARLLLEQRLSVSQILVVTYTTAATAELRERIRNRLAELLAIYQHGAGEDALLNELHARYPDTDSYRRLLLAVHGFDEAAIFTIHGFCQRALQDAAFDAGGDFDSELMQDDRELIDAVLADLWRHELAQAEPEWAAFLAQRRITPKSLRQRLRSHLGKPYLQVAPQVTDGLELQGLQQHWQQARDSWQQHSHAWLEELKAFDGFKKNIYDAARISNWQTELDGYFNDPAAIFDKQESLRRFSREALLKGSKKGFDVPLVAVADDIQRLLESLEETAPQAEQRLIQLHVKLLAQLNEQLPQRKAQERVMAFDDLLNRLQQALHGEGGEQLALRLREQYPVALIDEFQDTDPVQYDIFRHIYPTAADGSHLVFVGDPKQAIYAFRGADLATYLNARDEASRRYSLDTNHRSRAELISALNTLFSRPLPFAEAGLDYPPVSASKRERGQLLLPGADERALNLIWLGDEAMGKGSAVKLAAEDAARRIAALLAAGKRGEAGFLQDGQLTPLQGGDIAVLVASHNQAAEIAERLAALGVPSVRRGKDSVWHSEEAQELASVLSAYAEPGREGLLRYALATCLLGRSAVELAATQEDSRAWDEECETAERYHQLWQQRGFMRAFRTWLDEQQVAERLLQLEDGERRLTNLLHLAELLQAESLQRPGLERLLDWFNGQVLADNHGDDALLRLESDAERVQIVTIHTAKGLEYPLVFCPFLWDGSLLRQHEDITCHTDDGTLLLDLGGERYDEHRQRARQERFAERLRLAYVALTRARDRLWVHCGPIECKTRADGSSADSGLHTSALGWLLHGRGLPGQDALQELADHLQNLEPGDLYAEIRNLANDCDGQTAVLAPHRAVSHSDGEHRAPPPQQLSTLDHALQSAWRIGSFSGLASGMHMEAPDRDTLNIIDSSETGSGFFAFPRGARAGTCLHAIFEDWARDKAPLNELVEPTLTAHGIDAAKWGEIALAQLQRVLDTDLDGTGLTLSGLQAARRLPELEFTFPVAKLDTARLRTLLTDPDNGLAEPLRQAAQHLEFDTLNGFLKGFIDLTFEYRGRWYILDYKSNWLGPDSSHYGPDRLLQALASEHYYLQYLIYLTALRRFLRSRLQQWDDALLGGAYYLFLRGMPQAGVYFTRPDDHLLDALDHLFAEADA